MFEARLAASVTLKKILDAIKDLVSQANFDCSADGISLQVGQQRHNFISERIGDIVQYGCAKQSLTDFFANVGYGPSTCVSGHHDITLPSF